MVFSLVVAIDCERGVGDDGQQIHNSYTHKNRIKLIKTIKPVQRMNHFAQSIENGREYKNPYEFFIASENNFGSDEALKTISTGIDGIIP